jgi:lipoprotein-releasing system permease protein
MSYEFFISLRYLRAKRKQVFVSIITFISIAGIALGVAALIIVLGVMNGFETELRNKILGINAHILLTKYSGGIENYSNIQNEIAGIKGIVASTPVIMSQVILKKNDNIIAPLLRAVSVDSASSVINLGRMVEGGMGLLSEKNRDPRLLPKSLESMPGMVVGKELAKNFGLSLYDTVDIVLPTGISTPMGMMPRIKKFVVVGIFDSGFYEHDASLIYTSLEDAQNFLNMKGTVTGIEIKVKDIYKARSIADAIEMKLGFPFWARDWMQMNKNLFSALKLEKRVMFLILTLIVLVAAFNIISSLIMIVMEKNKDIAILKTMGATSRNIMKIFMLQGLIIGVIGTILGSAAGLTIALNLEQISMFLEKTFGFKFLPSDVYYLSSLPSQVNYADVALIITATLLISFLATIYPSKKASRIDPAEALRYE